MNRTRIIALVLIVIATLMGTAASVSASAPPDLGITNRIASQTELRAAFPAASSSQLKDLGKIVTSRHAKCDYQEGTDEDLAIR